MPRAARIYTEEGIFHILTRGNNKQRVFHDEADFQAYKTLLKKLKEEHQFKLYHYCLMNNHVRKLGTATILLIKYHDSSIKICQG